MFNPVSLIGSSPLTRGKHQHVGWGEYDERLIPAHAGKTPPACRQGHHQGAHPRSRGENASRDAHSSEPTGSSPLTRGKPRGGGLEVGDNRLIPAHAGKTPRPLFRGPVSPAHPRSRGENRMAPTTSRAVCGSSPLTRGKQADRHALEDAVRLIPAHAGKTLCLAFAGPLGPAHPRSRGENALPVKINEVSSGSSPLTRGKHCSGLSVYRAGGLIPAHAGKTLPREEHVPARRAHPRSRGENRTQGNGPGSSPGLIPAHAGKTMDDDGVGLPLPAHPRSRGENWEPIRAYPVLTGSSPLTRGKRR